jgi:hypothetical protein
MNESLTACEEKAIDVPDCSTLAEPHERSANQAVSAVGCDEKSDEGRKSGRPPYSKTSRNPVS